MKKLDKLILQSFIGPFILTFLVAVFILLIQYMLKYFDDFVGKDLGIGVFGELMMYFSVNMVPMALPLAILISSLMTYGQLGEHFELTAIKSAGISLPRVLLPTFILVVFLSIGAFFLNNYLVPYANLRAYSLLYDIKHQKPALDLKEGQFYGGLTGYSMKVRKKHKDDVAMSDIIIYDHSNSNGNKKVILADSCRMYTFINDRYLMMELFEGNHYVEEDNKKKKGKKDSEISRFVRTKFKRMDLVFSLSSFDLDRTSMDLFAGNRYMKSVKELTQSIDSMRFERNAVSFKLYRSMAGNYRLNFGGYIEPKMEVLQVEIERESIKEVKRKRDSVLRQQKRIVDTDSVDVFKDSLLAKESKKKVYSAKGKRKKRFDDEENEENRSSQTVVERLDRYKENKSKKDSVFIRGNMSIDSLKAKIDAHFSLTNYGKATEKALNLARSGKSTIKSTLSREEYFAKSINSHVVEKYKKFAQALSCILMFLIGAPLGAIIKRGGLGLPIIFGVIFFIIFYVFTSASDKWAKALILDGAVAAWIADVVMLPFGIFFLIQARRDARLFDTDIYMIWIDKIVAFWKNRNKENLKLLFKK